MKKIHLTSKGIKSEYCPYVDEFDNPVGRPKNKHPYTYEGFVVWRGGSNSERNGTVYSDQLSQWDYNKNTELKKKHFGSAGDYFYHREPQQIEAYLRDYMDDQKLKLILIMEYCTVSNGYPVWRFDYKSSTH